MHPIISLAAIARFASVALLGATAAGVSVLTWATVTTQGDEPTEPAPQAEARTSDTPTPPPVSPTPPTSASLNSRFTADQAIVYATHFSDAEDLSHVEATLMTYAEAREFTNNSTIFPKEPDSDSPTWLIAFTGRFYTAWLGDFNATGSPAAPALCTTEYIYLVEDPLVPIRSAVRADSCTDHHTIAREVAIFNAARIASDSLAYGIPISVSAEFMTVWEAAERSDELARSLVTADIIPDLNVWFVTFIVDFAPGLSISPTPFTTLTPSPTPSTPVCTEVVVILKARSGDRMIAASHALSSCSPQATPPPFPVTTLTPTPSLMPPSTEHDSPIPTPTVSPPPYDPPLIPSPTPTPTPTIPSGTIPTPAL